MEPDVIRMYSSSPPPMDDGGEEEDDEFGDFGTFSAVSNSISLSELDTPTTFNQTQALAATSPPELLNSRGVVGFGLGSANGELSKANGHLGGGPSDRTDRKRVISGALDFHVTSTAVNKPSDCNGGGAEVLTNGFATFEIQGSPSSKISVHAHLKGTSTEDAGGGGGVPVGSSEEDFADFAAFSDAERPTDEDSDGPAGGRRRNERRHEEQGTTTEDDIRDTSRTGPAISSSDSISVPAGGSCNTDRGAGTDADSKLRDVAFAHSASEAVCTKNPPALNGVDVAGGDGAEDAAGFGESDLSPDAAGDSESGPSDGKDRADEAETETETETSLGRTLSTDALEEYGDMSTTTASAPSLPLQEDVPTPADHSQLAEDEEEEDFGDFGDAGSFGRQGFPDFEQSDAGREEGEAPAADDDDDDFGDFNSPKFHAAAAAADGQDFADFPVSDSFGNFSSAVDRSESEADAGWDAFGEAEQPQAAAAAEAAAAGESWAAFGSEETAAPPDDSAEDWYGGEPPPLSKETSRTETQLATLSSRLVKLFQSSFPQSAAAPVDDEVASLKSLLEPREEAAGRDRAPRGGVWTQLQDIHEAFGLRHQWGGSYCNKALLCCLGIDTRNILFTGQKKQPVIVPMYAASLGMLEPTKEPVKPVSAAEMIASIAQAPPGAPEKTPCPSDTVQQETLPPVQFDWSSSGLTNPLDASGGSFLLNLDFFGPVEDSGSGSSPSIPGVDPELFELTTTKMDAGGSGSRVADAFARLMSTMEKTSTSTRRPRKDENLSEEAAKVIAGLPDLSFMQAKVLMFPATLTPLGCQATPD